MNILPLPCFSDTSHHSPLRLENHPIPERRHNGSESVVGIDQSSPSPCWNPWTHLSENIPFKSTTKGVGDGEEKTAAELNTVVRGPNSPYDLMANINGIDYQCDVKKLDNNTFNTGVKGRDAIRRIKFAIERFILICKNISKSHLLTPTEQQQVGRLEEISPDEICVSNIGRIHAACIMLYEKQRTYREFLPIISPFETNGNPVEMPLDKYYAICKILDRPFCLQNASVTQVYEEYIIFLENISHEYVSDPDKFRSSLDGLVSIFEGVKLIFVDEKKGYYIFDKLEDIRFERITRGNPRFRVIH